VATGPGLHSRVVAVLKLGLPLVAIGMLAALFLAQTDDTIGGGVKFSEGDIEALGEGLRITNPTFTGTTGGEDRFRFTAAEVLPDAAPPTRADITRLAGTLELADGPVVSLEAETGDLHIPTQRLDPKPTLLEIVCAAPVQSRFHGPPLASVYRHRNPRVAATIDHADPVAIHE
jgi:lipopolysaccharide export system protein LptC